MQSGITFKRIALVGGGPAALFMYKRLIGSGTKYLEITIFEKEQQLGAGMPYSSIGAAEEHITNVSGNEIPDIVSNMKDWLYKAPSDLLNTFKIKPGTFNEYKVVPRLLFGQYLADQFSMLYKEAQKAGITTNILLNTKVLDIKDEVIKERIKVVTDQDEIFYFDMVVICTGHTWPKKQEEKVANWFDSPYPPAKLKQKINFPVAIKGSSLTAIDAVRTLARENGTFEEDDNGKLTYRLNEDSPAFALVLHSLGGLLPAIRFHLQDTHLSPDSPITEDEVYEIKKAHDGFLPLDYIFERNFKQPLEKYDPEFYNEIKDWSIETFVDHMMDLRERLDPFTLFKAEYAEAEQSIKRRESVMWKERLAVLSYAMNYPAKHISAEDMLRLKKILMPLISIVIAFVPQSSCRELIALHEANVLSMVAVDKKSKVEPAETGGAWYSYTDEEGLAHKKHYPMFIDAVGQPPVMYNDVPFESLKNEGTISAAHLRFKTATAAEKEIAGGNKLVRKEDSDHYYLQVPGISINDNFQVLDAYGVFNSRIYIMAVPYIGGLNPDYSGLDFCETASGTIIDAMLQATATAEKEA